MKTKERNHCTHSTWRVLCCPVRSANSHSLKQRVLPNNIQQDWAGSSPALLHCSQSAIKQTQLKHTLLEKHPHPCNLFTSKTVTSFTPHFFSQWPPPCTISFTRQVLPPEFTHCYQTNLPPSSSFSPGRCLQQIWSMLHFLFGCICL